MSSGTPYPYQPTIRLAPAAAYSETYWQNRHRNCARCRKKCGRKAQSRWRHIISSRPALRRSDRTHKDEMGGRALETNECTIFPSMTALVRSRDSELRQPRLLPSHNEVPAAQKGGANIVSNPYIRFFIDIDFAEDYLFLQPIVRQAPGCQLPFLLPGARNPQHKIHLCQFGTCDPKVGEDIRNSNRSPGPAVLAREVFSVPFEELKGGSACRIV
jgi:hypothetical protein